MTKEDSLNPQWRAANELWDRITTIRRQSSAMSALIDSIADGFCLPPWDERLGLVANASDSLDRAARLLEAVAERLNLQPPAAPPSRYTDAERDAILKQVATVRSRKPEHADAAPMLARRLPLPNDLEINFWLISCSCGKTDCRSGSVEAWVAAPKSGPQEGVFLAEISQFAYEHDRQSESAWTLACKTIAANIAAKSLVIRR